MELQPQALVESCMIIIVMNSLIHANAWMRASDSLSFLIFLCLFDEKHYYGECKEEYAESYFADN